MFEELRGEVIVGIITATVSAVGAYLSYHYFHRSSERERQNQELELAQWKNQYLAEIRLWADEGMNALSRGLHLCELDPVRTAEPGFFERRHTLMVDLSSIIDRGRWFFPNEEMSASARDRRIFFRGYRDPILDPLVAAYEFARHLNYVDPDQNKALRDDFLAAKQDFGSKMQIVLDPGSRNADFERFLTLTEALRATEEKAPT